MGDAYEFTAGHNDSQELQQHAREIGRCVAKLKGNSRSSQIKVLYGLLEHLPQDVAGLGAAKAREALLECLIDRTILNSKQKDVRMYAAACFAHLLRIYAPDTPYDDKQLEPVFELLLWSIQQVQEFQAPSFELAVSVLQVISQTKSYFIVLDWGREELVLEWVRTLLQCINTGSSALAGRHALELLVGIVSEDGSSEAVLEVLLAHLVPPRSTENPMACQMAQAVLKACEGCIKPALQKFLTTLILSPISSNTDLHQHCYALIYQLYSCVPQVLLPVIPHLTSELHAEEGAKRQEACQLLGRLLSLPGNRLVNEYTDVLDALLRRFSDTQATIRLTMLDFTPSLVSAAGTEELQQQVLSAAAERLQDYDDKVRVAAVKAVCQAARQLLVGPPTSPPTTAAGPGSANPTALLSPVDALLGGIGSQELEAAAAADLDLATAADLGSPGLPAAAVAAAVRDVPWVHEALKRVYLRLRDTKPAVRKAAASHFLSIFRAVVAAGDGGQVARCCWLPARVLLCCKTDKELRVQVVEGLAREGLLGPKTPPAQAAAAWVRLWLASSDPERDGLQLLLSARSKLQVDLLQFLALRRKLSGRQAAGSDDNSRLTLESACRALAQQLPQPDRALEALGQLLQVRDNHVFALMQAAAAPGGSQEAYVKARADALARVGSRSAAAEVVGQLLLWGRPAAWLPPPIMSALLALVAGDPEGEQGELVRGAYQMLLSLCKVAPLLFAGLLPQLHQLAVSPDADLQLLGVQALARCAAQMRKCGALLSTSPDAELAQLTRQQLLPALRSISRGQQPHTPGSEAGERLLSPGYDSSQEGRAGVSPKAAKWAVYGLAACQDSSSSRRELQELADELADGLDASASDTAAKLQALSTVGRLVPDALSRHMETLLHFVTEEYFNSYLDAAARAADMPGSGSSGHRRSAGGSGLLSPVSQATASATADSQAADAAGLALKCAALKALAAGCVPDSDGMDAPVETLRVVARLATFLEGLLEPGEEARPLFLADAPHEMCSQLRQAAALALLRLARRHDARISPATYSALALVMQDEEQAVRGLFADKVYRLMRFFMARPSTHQLSAKYAAMLPLASADPLKEHKDKAARLLRSWVHERRSTLAAQVAAAARSAQEGGSTLQEQPEMMLPYGLYILAHHPDFPQEGDADVAECYTPFQHMLQFMLQPLLVASRAAPAGAMAPALVKMCRTIKRTADATEFPTNMQLYCLCDMADQMISELLGAMQLQLADLNSHSGAVILPKGLYRPLDKAERVDTVSYLPPGYQFIPDPDPPPALAAAMTAAAAAPVPAAKGTRARAGAGGTTGRGRGSKRKATAAAAAGGGGTSHQEDMSERGGAEGQGPQVKRSRGGGAAGGRSRAKAQGNAAAAADSDDDGWGSDSEDAPPSAQKADQLTRRQQVLRQQKQLRERVAALADGVAAAEAAADAAGSDAEDEVDAPDGRHQQQQQQEQQAQPVKQQQQRQGRQQAGRPPGVKQQRRQQQPPDPQQRQAKQQQLTFAAAAAADASSPAPVRRGRQAVPPGRSPEQQMNGHAASSSSGGGGDDVAGHDSSQHGGAGEGSMGESPFALANTEAQQEAPASQGRHAGQRASGAVKPTRHSPRQQRQQQQPQPAALRAKAAPSPRAKRGATAAAATAHHAGSHGDVEMDDDQQQAGQARAARGKLAAGKRAAGGVTKKAAAAAGAAAVADKENRRSTRRRAA